MFILNIFFLDGKKPSIAAIQGYALGGGLELVMVWWIGLASYFNYPTSFKKKKLINKFCDVLNSN